MLSVILVPIISAFLVTVLIFLLSPRRRQDAPAAAQYQLRRAIAKIDAQTNKLTKKELTHLDITVNKAKGFISRAKFDERYDMTIPYDAATKAREITQAMLIAQPQTHADYLIKVRAYLLSASNYIVAYCGVSASGAGSAISLKKFSRKAKQDKAKKHLSGLDSDEN